MLSTKTHRVIAQTQYPSYQYPSSSVVFRKQNKSHSVIEGEKSEKIHDTITRHTMLLPYLRTFFRAFIKSDSDSIHENFSQSYPEGEFSG